MLRIARITLPMHAWLPSLSDLQLIALGSAVFAYGLFTYLMALGDVADRRTIENTATSKCRSLALGTVEVAGTVTGRKPFPSLIARIPCFISRVVVQEKVKGRHGEGWVTVHRREFRIPFYVQDETGKVKVDPHNAVLQLRPDVEYSGPDDTSDYAPHALDLAIEKGPTRDLDGLLREYCELRGLAASTNIRFTESNLSPGDPVYIFGTAVAGKDLNGESEPVVIRKTIWQPLYISESSENEALQSFGRRIVRRLLIGPACIAGGVGILASVLARTTDLAQFSFWGFPFTAMGAAMGALATVTAIGFVFYLVIIFNGLISLRNEVERSWANIDVLLKQRFDVVPNLVETCKGYMDHERELLTRIAASHSGWTAAATLDGKVKAASDSGQALQRLLLVAEAYPTLRANETFAQLQGFLTEIEAQIADRRELYNSAVGLFNTRVKQIPDRLVASLLGYPTFPFFAAPSAMEAPVVAFAAKQP